MRRFLWLITLIALLVPSGCAAAVAVKPTPAPDNSFRPNDLVAPYFTIIDTMYKEDAALNGDQYIAVDTSAMANLDRSAKDKILKATEQYGRTVLEGGFDSLEDKGYIKDLRFEHGCLLILKDHPPTDGIITVEAEKWENGAGADFCKFDLQKKGGVWEIIRRYDQAVA